MQRPPVYAGFQSPAKAGASNARAGCDRSGASSARSTPPRQQPPLRSTTTTLTADAASAAAANRFDSALPSMNIGSSLDDDNTFEPLAATSHVVVSSGSGVAPARPTYAASNYNAAQYQAPAAAPPSQPVARAAVTSVGVAAPVISHSVSAAALANAAASTPALSVQEMLPAVRSFLQSVYSDPSSIPALEIMPHTVQSLYQLQAHVHDNDERAAILEEEMREATKEYNAEATRLDSILSRLAVSPSALSAPARSHLDTLVSLAQMLELKNVDPTTSMLALIDLRDQSHSLISTVRDLQSDHAAALSSTSSSLSLLTELRRLTAERAELLRSASELQVSQSKQIPYFATKQREYERETNDIEQRLSRAGWNESLSHASLTALSAEIAQISCDIEPIDAQLQVFQQLPPDLTLSRVRVAEARQQLAELESEFSHQIHAMHAAEEER